MQNVKSLFIGLVVLGLAFCAITSYLPRHITLTREATFCTRPDSLQSFLQDFHQWPRWCTWLGRDSVVTRRYEKNTVIWYPNGRPDQKNFIFLLQSGRGDVRLDYQFHGLLPATGGFLLERVGDSTRLTWNLLVKLHWYPWEKLSGIAMDKVWGKSMDASLRNLKACFGDTLSIPAENQ